MKGFVFIVLVAIAFIANGSAAGLTYLSPLRTIIYPAPHVYSAHSSSLITPSQQQYHIQDAYGQYSYGYNEPLSAKQEVRSLDGVTRGSYSYRDADGKLQTVAYTADSNGFHVAATNLPRAIPTPEQSNLPETPTPITDTVEVASARNAHLAAYQAVKLRHATSESNTIGDRSESRPIDDNNVRSVELPKPVEDTPAVAIAKAQHLKRFEQERLRNEIIGSSASAQHAAVLGYTYGYPLSARILTPRYFY